MRNLSRDLGVGFVLRQALFLVLGLSFLSNVSFAEFRVGLVLDKGGKDDKSFNSSAYAGAMKAKDDLKVFVKYVEASDDNSFEPMLRAFAQKDFDLVIGIGVSMRDAMEKV